jgi:type IV pilus assembly protein PilM
MSLAKILKDTLTIKFDKAFGLDIGDGSVEIIEMEKVFKFSAVTYGRTELEEGVVDNGRIISQPILAEKIKKLLKDAKPKRVSTNKVIVSLPESQVFVQCFPVDAKLKGSALNLAILDKVSARLPMIIDKVYWDFVEKPLADKTKKLIMFFGVPKDVANSYVKFCNSIGLEVVSLCIESLSLARTVLKSSPKQSLIIDLGARSTNLSFFDSNDKINMSITIPVAGEMLTEAIRSKLKIETAEAESLKVKLGFKDSKENNVRPIILPLFEDIMTETKQAIEYYEETFKQKLEDIYIIGGSALLPGIVDVAKASLKREVQIANSVYNTNLNAITGKNNSFPLYANVIGLGMLGASGEFKDMNLLKKMPAAEVNSVNKLNLFNMGYLSKVNTLRTILDNKYVLVVLIILIGIVFAVLYQQAQNYGFATASGPTLSNSFFKW